MKLLPFAHPNARPYNWLIYQLNHRFFEKHMPLIRGDVYDLGCGEMPYRKWLLECADTYTGIDWMNSQHAVKPDIFADLNEPLPVVDAVADTIICFSVLEHLHEPQLLLSEAYRLLRPSGTILLQVPFMWWVHEAPHDYFRFTEHGLRHLFRAAGFQEVEVIPQTGFWTMAALKVNYQLVQLTRGPWPLNLFLKLMMLPAWTLNQWLAPLFDKYWRCPEETAGYFVVAKKH